MAHDDTERKMSLFFPTGRRYKVRRTILKPCSPTYPGHQKVEIQPGQLFSNLWMDNYDLLWVLLTSPFVYNFVDRLGTHHFWKNQARHVVNWAPKIQTSKFNGCFWKYWLNHRALGPRISTSIKHFENCKRKDLRKYFYCKVLIKFLISHII